MCRHVFKLLMYNFIQLKRDHYTLSQIIWSIHVAIHHCLSNLRVGPNHTKFSAFTTIVFRLRRISISSNSMFWLNISLCYAGYFSMYTISFTPSIIIVLLPYIQWFIYFLTEIKFQLSVESCLQSNTSPYSLIVFYHPLLKFRAGKESEGTYALLRGHGLVYIISLLCNW